MKTIPYSSLVIILNLGFLFTEDSAYPLENGVRQMGIFQPIVYGMKNNLEISTHPLLFFLKPNFKVKKYYTTIKGAYAAINSIEVLKNSNLNVINKH